LEYIGCKQTTGGLQKEQRSNFELLRERNLRSIKSLQNWPNYLRRPFLYGRAMWLFQVAPQIVS
jgi:hypothetical protein